MWPPSEYHLLIIYRQMYQELFHVCAFSTIYGDLGRANGHLRAYTDSPVTIFFCSRQATRRGVGLDFVVVCSLYPPYVIGVAVKSLPAINSFRPLMCVEIILSTVN